MTVTPPVLSSVTRLPFDRFGSFPELFKSYLTDYPSVAEFYPGDFRDPDVRRKAVEAAADFPRDRQRLVEILLDQNARWGPDEKVRSNIQSLLRTDSAAVVTGQQVGLLVGPLYTPYKIITVLQLADELSKDTGRPVVPIFWLEGEDHDFQEISSIKLLHQNGVATLEYHGNPPPETGNHGPVGNLVLTDEIERITKEVDALLPPTEFRDRVLDAIRAAYRPGVTLLDAFARLLRFIFSDSGLILIDPGDARLKQLSASLFRKELLDYTESHARLEEVSSRLQERFHVQVHPRPVQLFLIEEDGRFSLNPTEDGFTLRGKQAFYRLDELLSLLDAHPEKFSPNVVMRPLMQDYLLPTAAYVAGPGEISYFAQFKPIYEWAGIPMPVIYPRATVTLVENRIRKQLERYDLDLLDFEGDIEPLFRRVVLSELDVDLEGAFQSATNQVHEAVSALRPVIQQVDGSLVKSSEALRVLLVKEVEKFKDKVVKAEKRRHEELYGRLEKARENLFPGGKLQERAISPIYFLNKYSPELIVALREVLSLDTTEHQVVFL